MICVAANPSVDTLFEVERLERDAIHRPTTLTRVPGGKGLNLARAAVALGAEPVAVALLAGHVGAWIAESATAQGVTLRATWAPGETRSCLSVLDDAGAELTEFYETGVEVDAAHWGAFAAAVLAECAPGRWVALCGSLPPGVGTDAYRELARGASERGSLVAVDASGSPLAAALAAGPDLVKVNQAEAQELLGATGASGSRARELRALAGGGERVAVITRGAEGAVLAGPSDELLAGRPPTRAPYAVGSGDCFLAGLLVGRERGLGWSDALALGIAAGAANAELPGAGVLSAARAEELAESIEVDVRD